LKITVYPGTVAVFIQLTGIQPCLGASSDYFRRQFRFSKSWTLGRNEIGRTETRSQPGMPGFQLLDFTRTCWSSKGLNMAGPFATRLIKASFCLLID
jgi:hypothetical protein